jgi:hypothetical protein
MRYRAQAVLVALATVLGVAPAAGAEGSVPFRSEPQFNQWVQNYYQHPAPDALLDVLVYYSTSTLYATAHARMPMAQFFASAYGDDPSRLGAVVTAAEQQPSANTRMFVARVLWLVNSDSSRSLLKHASEAWHDKNVQALLSQFGDQPPRDLLRSPVRTPDDLDMLWSMFFATGDRRPIEQLVIVLPLLKEGHGLAIVFGGAAQWSLQSNAARHPKLLAILKDLSQESNGTTKELLEEIVSAAQTKPGT